LFHTSKPFERKYVVLMVSDVPGNFEQRSDHRGNADDDIVCGTKEVNRAGKEKTLDGLSETLRYIDCRWRHELGRRRGDDCVVMEWLEDGRVEVEKALRGTKRDRGWLSPDRNELACQIKESRSSPENLVVENSADRTDIV
jgi:hypothetical protein